MQRGVLGLCQPPRKIEKVFVNRGYEQQAERHKHQQIGVVRPKITANSGHRDRSVGRQCVGGRDSAALQDRAKKRGQRVVPFHGRFGPGLVRFLMAQRLQELGIWGARRARRGINKRGRKAVVMRYQLLKIAGVGILPQFCCDVVFDNLLHQHADKLPVLAIQGHRHVKNPVVRGSRNHQRPYRALGFGVVPQGIKIGAV